MDNDKYSWNLNNMVLPFITAIFFPDYGYQGIPWDLYLLHFFFFAIVIPFHVIIFAARSAQKVKPNGVKDWLKWETNTSQEGIASRFPNNFPTAWLALKPFKNVWIYQGATTSLNLGNFRFIYIPASKKKCFICHS